MIPVSDAREQGKGGGEPEKGTQPTIGTWPH